MQRQPLSSSPAKVLPAIPNSKSDNTNLAEEIQRMSQARDQEREVLGDLQCRVVDIASKEYAAEAARLDRILDLAGIRSRVPESTLSVIETLADAGTKLGISDGSLGSFQCAIFDLNRELTAAQAECDKLERTTKFLEEQRNYVEIKEREIEQLVMQLKENGQIDSHILRQWMHDTEILETKGWEYTDRLEMLEESCEVDLESVRLPALKEIEAQTHALVDELERQEITLQSFKDLPPDITLSQIKVEERKAELVSLINMKEELLQAIAQGIST
ncbi:hypothetical protein HK102_003323 [Quaeritorhiza haematococci]|nr:hypothetical protein HK102_003323 [Quaeritorhiza haematococci]